MLQQVLANHPYGVAGPQLLASLNALLQSPFDAVLFGCATFEEYLIKYAEQYVDVLVKARGCIVYPKGAQVWMGWNQYQYYGYAPGYQYAQ